VAEHNITNFWKIKTLPFFLLPFGSQRGKVYGTTTTLTTNRLNAICFLHFFSSFWNWLWPTKLTESLIYLFTNKTKSI